MIDIDKVGEKADKADSAITKLKNLLKNHWGFLLLCLLGYGVYLFISMVGEEMKNPTKHDTPEAEPTIETTNHAKEYKLIKAAYFIDDNGYRAGDTVYVDHYDDGVIEEYYTDGEVYKKD